MPQFFDPAKLTERQRLRWGDAELEFARAAQEALHFLQLESPGGLTDLEARYLADVAQPSPQSALFARLLDGMQPLPLRPPTSYSYPRYELFDAPRPFQVHAHAFDGDHLTINQCAWRKLAEENGAYTVSFGSWEHCGWTWKLSRERIKADLSETMLVAHYDHNLPGNRLTTVEQVRANSNYLARIGLDHDPLKPGETVEQRADRVFDVYFSRKDYGDPQLEAENGDLYFRAWVLSHRTGTMSDAEAYREERLQRHPLPAPPAKPSGDQPGMG